MYSIKKGAKVEVSLSFVSALGGAVKGLVEESGFKPNQNSGRFKFRWELSIKKRAIWASIELYDEVWFE